MSDAEKPVISDLPDDITRNADQGSATTAVNWVEPTATDNSGSQILTSNHSPGDSYPIGVTAVEYTSVDPSGNTEMQSFTITINGNFEIRNFMVMLIGLLQSLERKKVLGTQSSLLNR